MSFFTNNYPTWVNKENNSFSSKNSGEFSQERPQISPGWDDDNFVTWDSLLFNWDNISDFASWFIKSTSLAFSVVVITWFSRVTSDFSDGNVPDWLTKQLNEFYENNNNDWQE